MKYRWTFAPEQAALAGWLGRQLSLSPLLAQCLLNRGLSDAEEITAFLDPRLANLRDPFLIPNLRTAVDRLFQARERRELIVVFGDYDVDGVTSTTLLCEALSRLGWRVESYLPHRMDEGYGLTRDGVLNCLERFPVELLLAVDCGSTAHETITWLKAGNIDTLVLDHHQVSDPAPPAVALVNPQLAAAGEPDFRELCSVGLAFKLVHGLVKTGRAIGDAVFTEFDLRDYLDLVALGTIADLVPLRRENRILASAGLRYLDQTKRPGLVALKEVANVESPVSTFDVGFLLGPRLNASGRLETASESLELLQAETLEEAMPLALDLDSRNRERQQIERTITEEVTGIVRGRFDPAIDYVIIEGRLLWHIGVVGIVASRIQREFYRPTIIIGGEGDAWRGSGRSIEGFDLAAALRECDDLLIRHGGHAMAAGLSLRPENLDAFRARLNDIARKSISPDLLKPAIKLDAVIRGDDLNLDTIHALGRLSPLGQENPTIKLCLSGVQLDRAPRRIGRDGRHVKMQVTDGRQCWETVWWEGGDARWPVGVFDLAFVPEISTYNGQTRLQLRLLDWRPHRPSAGPVAGS